jgi:hypothetical protein
MVAYGNMPVQEGPLIFIHIPKSAGRTLKSVIDRQFNQSEVYSISGDVHQAFRSFTQLPESEREKFRYINGHMYFGIHHYTKKPCNYITMLRHPINRVISHYYYVLRSPDHYLYTKVKSENMSLEDYVSNDLSTELENGQTRFISGIKTDEHATFEMLEKAKINISNSFIIAGVMERFDESLILMKKALGWKNVFYIKGNVNPKRTSKAEIPESTLRLIQSKNQLDMELYTFVKDNFDKLVRHEKISFQSEVQLFRFMNRLYGRYCRIVGKLSG